MALRLRRRLPLLHMNQAALGQIHKEKARNKCLISFLTFPNWKWKSGINALYHRRHYLHPQAARSHSLALVYSLAVAIWARPLCDRSRNHCLNQSPGGPGLRSCACV